MPMSYGRLARQPLGPGDNPCAPRPSATVPTCASTQHAPDLAYPTRRLDAAARLAAGSCLGPATARLAALAG